MTGKYVLAIDQGTTSSRAIIFDHSGQIVATGQKEHEQIFPRAGWVEHDPKEIWDNIREVVAEALAKASMNKDDIVAVGVTNQRETAMVWDKNTGEPVYNAIVWQDTRTDKIVKELGGGDDDKYKAKVGLPLATYFSGPKVKWILDNVEGAREKAEAGDLIMGNMDTWVIWNLTGGTDGGVHVTDVTNASRTMLMDLDTLAWDEGIAKDMGIPLSMLPEIKSSSEVYGEGRSHGLLAGVPIAGDLGDQQAATFGQAAFEVGMAKNTYGTGCFMLMNTGDRAVRSRNQLLATVGWQGPDAAGAHRTAYCLEGSVFMAGATVQWLRDGLQMIQSASEIEALAASVPDTGDVFLVPAFAGLGAPDWDGRARGTLVGLTRGTTRAHIARAALEAIALQSADIFGAMVRDSGIQLTELRVDGGASRNDLLMQLQADLAGVPVVRPQVTETTALGAAYLAGLATGVWQGGDEIAAQWAVDRRFEPSLPEPQRLARIARWREAVERSRGWARDGA